ncbi:hypothetical protein YC2023_017439 [Brassica napus]
MNGQFSERCGSMEKHYAGRFVKSLRMADDSDNDCAASPYQSFDSIAKICRLGCMQSFVSLCIQIFSKA